MRFSRLGNSGLKVSVVGLGTNNFGRRLDEVASARVVHAALDGGITFIDTADVYGAGQSEEFLGKAIKRRRDEVVLATKFSGGMGDGPYLRGGSRRYVRAAVEASLRRLQTDYIDLYQYHHPDPDTPIEETLDALNDLVHEGKVRYLGASNFDGWQLVDASWVARVNHLVPFVSDQIRYSLISRNAEREIVPAAERVGAGIIPFFPLEAGVLTGKYRRGEPPPPGTRMAGHPSPDRFLNERSLDIVDALRAFADEHGVNLLDVAIGGLAAQPQVSSVIAGATKVEQVEANIRAGEWQPSSDEMAEINRITG